MTKSVSQRLLAATACLRTIKGVRFRGKIIIILSFTREHAVTRKIVTRDRGGGSQMASVINVLQGGGGFTMAQICVM